jgi:hypothetical protein
MNNKFKKLKTYDQNYEFLKNFSLFDKSRFECSFYYHLDDTVFYKSELYKDENFLDSKYNENHVTDFMKPIDIQNTIKFEIMHEVFYNIILYENPTIEDCKMLKNELELNKLTIVNKNIIRMEKYFNISYTDIIQLLNKDLHHSLKNEILEIRINERKYKIKVNKSYHSFSRLGNLIIKNIRNKKKVTLYCEFETYYEIDYDHIWDHMFYPSNILKFIDILEIPHDLDYNEFYDINFYYKK